MKNFTSKAILCAAVLVAVSANAQLRWNPADWECTAISNGASYVEDPENKTMQWHPYSHNADDVTLARGDIRLKIDCQLTVDEPYLVYYLTLDGASISYRDWKYQIMREVKNATSCTANADGTYSYTWEDDPASFNDQNKEFFSSTATVEKYKLLNKNVYYNNSTKEEESSAAGYDVFVLDMTMFNSEKFFDNGDVVDMPFIPTNTVISGEGTAEAVQQRSWISNVCIAAQIASKNPTDATFCLRYVATVEDPNDALNMIEEYEAGEGGKELRDGDEGGVAKLRNNEQISVWQSEKGVISAPSATRIVAYTITGVKVADVNATTLSLPAGIYIIKAFNNATATTVKTRVSK